MNRPVPVVLSAILLGILAVFQLIAAAGMLFVGVLTVHKSVPGMAASPTPLPPAFFPAMFFGLSVFYVAVAVWFIFTLVGLWRLRSWARYSLLVIAGLTAVFAGMGALTSFAMPFLMPQLPGATPAPSAQIIHGIFLFIGLFYLIFTAIGVAQLIYFNLARTRAVFQQADPAILAPPNTVTGRYRPTAIAVISWFFMICSPSCLLYAFLPFPGMLFGFPIYGFAAHALYVAFALIGFSVGYTLYRLRPQAPIALIAWMAFGILNMLPLFTPWGHRNFTAYMQRFSPPGALTPNPFLSTGVIAVSCIFCLAFNAFILWLLYRHREAFTPAPPAPPMPPGQFLEAPLPG
jgi:hypothetical protein